MSFLDGSKISVLIVDDSRVVRLAAAKMLGDEFDITLAVDGAEAMTIIENDRSIAMVVTDLAMPEMDGFELLSAIRQNPRPSIQDLPVIVATGAGNTAAAKEKAFSLGATDFISKPFNGIDLKARVRSYARFQQTASTLQTQVTIDSLTGLLNRRGMYKQLEKETSFVARHSSSITVLQLEIDDYKDLFVKIGRYGTEKLIKKVANVLGQTFRKEDSVSRSSLAGFTISLPMAEPSKVVKIATRIAQTIEAFKAKLDGKRIKITVSIGVSNIGYNEEVTINDLLGMCTKSLDLAQSQGASQVRYLTASEYAKMKKQDAQRSLSIDKILEEIEKGNALDIANQLEGAIIRVSPMLELLSNEQFQRIFEMRQHKDGNVYDINKYRA